MYSLLGATTSLSQAQRNENGLFLKDEADCELSGITVKHSYLSFLSCTHFFISSFYVFHRLKNNQLSAVLQNLLKFWSIKAD